MTHKDIQLYMIIQETLTNKRTVEYITDKENAYKQYEEMQTKKPDFTFYLCKIVKMGMKQ